MPAYTGGGELVVWHRIQNFITTPEKTSSRQFVYDKMLVFARSHLLTLINTSVDSAGLGFHTETRIKKVSDFDNHHIKD